MSEIKVLVDWRLQHQRCHQALIDTVKRIRERIKPQFTNPLVIRYERNYLGLEMAKEIFTFAFARIRIIELRIFTLRKNRTLFSIKPSCGVICCSVDDRYLLDIAKEEVPKYAQILFDAHVCGLLPDVQITTNFVLE